MSFARAEGQCRTLRWACRCSASRAAPKAPCHFTPSARLFRRPSVGPPPVTRGRSRPRREVWAGSDGRNGLPKPPEKMRADRLEGATPPGLGTSFDAKNRSRDRTDAARTTRGRRVGGVRTGKRRGGGFVDTKRNPVRQCVISLRSRGKNAERASQQAGSHHNTYSCAFREKRRLTRARRRTSRRVQYHKHGLVVRARALSGTLVDSPG